MGRRYGKRDGKMFTAGGIPKSPFAFAKHSGYSAVYVVKDKELGRPCKIGISGDPPHRARSMLTDSWRKLELCTYFWFAGARVSERVESAAHGMVDEHRVHGEWFDIDGEEAEMAVVLAAKEVGVEIIDEEELASRHLALLQEQAAMVDSGYNSLDYFARRIHTLR